MTMHNRWIKVIHTGFKVSWLQTGKESLLATPKARQYAPQNALSHPEPARKKH